MLSRATISKNGLRFCCGCNKYKSFSLFHKKRAGRHGLTARCKDCTRLSERRQRYGLSAEEFESISAKQANSCAICKTKASESRLHVDHDHTTGIVRGLLCNLCNTGIGMLKESPEALRNALAYLTTNQEQ